MKTKFATDASTNRSCSGRISFPGVLRRSTLVLFVLFACTHANAGNPPASNMRGPLKTLVKGSPIEITTEIATDVAPAMSYSLVNNTSGASIISKGKFKFDSSTGVGTQTVLVDPGSKRGSFTIKSIATTPSGTCESSKTVTVATASTINGPYEHSDHVMQPTTK